MFKLNSKFSPSFSQKSAIEQLDSVYDQGIPSQILLGVTGSGKTFSMANLVVKRNKPTLVIAHNKTLAAQLYEEFCQFFPDNSVSYFVSYYDYYQPEAYLPSRDAYIEKEAQINKEIERLRHKATQALMTRKDVIIVASVSCIYGLGLPETYIKNMLHLSVDHEFKLRHLCLRLEAMQFERNDVEFLSGRYRVKGDVLDIFPASEDFFYHLEFFGDTLERIERRHAVDQSCLERVLEAHIFPATHYLLDEDHRPAIEQIRQELAERVSFFESLDKKVEAQRIQSRTSYDLAMLEEMGYCKGIENYSQPLSGRNPGDAPGVLLDFFPKDFLTIIDESHVTMPQLKGMHAGDRSRKTSLIDYGFRLPSAIHNRPLTLREFEDKTQEILYVSATPGPYEFEKTLKPKATHASSDLCNRYYLVEQLIRPTGLLDPEIIVKKTTHQMQDLYDEIMSCINRKERVLVTTLTKKFAENLSQYFQEKKLKSQYLHSDIQALDRVKILNELRSGKYDVLIGINLLREGLDLPEVSLVAILDADKEGFLRNERSLIQTIGRAARHLNGKAIMYADKITPSMKAAIDETERRRNIQIAYNVAHNITPKSIQKDLKLAESSRVMMPHIDASTPLSKTGFESLIAQLTADMNTASKNLEFELAASLRDQIDDLKNKALDFS
ncbi:MAG: excinuclease ABC subunit UvrB [bacterium]